MVRSYPTSTLFFYVGGSEVFQWADRSMLEAATLLFAEGQVETLKIGLRHRSQDQDTGAPADLPLIQPGHVPCIYIQRTGPDPEDYTTLFSGTVQTLTIGDQTWAGVSSLTIATPMKALKNQLGHVRFYPDALRHPNDITRLAALDTIWRNPDWDFHTFLGAANITYPEPEIVYVPAIGNGVALALQGERHTDYYERTVEDIIRDITTDPGQQSDTGYPVAARAWWIDARFKDPEFPEAGLTWYFNQRNIDSGPVVTPLTDAPTVEAPAEIVYRQGATLQIDYAPVVRRVHIKGPQAEATGLRFHSTLPVAHPEYLVSIGNGNRVRKVGGVDGDYDVQGVSDVQFYSDFDVEFQTQETYLEHDTFKRDDIDVLDFTTKNIGQDPAFPGGIWLPAYVSADTDLHNSVARISQRATPYKRTGTTISLFETNAATCIARYKVGVNRPGTAFLARAIRDNTTEMLLSALILINNGTGNYELWEWDTGTATLVGTSTAAPADLDNIKINAKYDRIEIYITPYGSPEGAYDFALEPETFNHHATMHGIGFFSDFGGNWWEGTITDVQITEFWGDKAIGVGDAFSGTDWSWIGYGLVFNVNGTFTIVRGGSVQATISSTALYTAADIALAAAALAEGYATNDAWRFTSYIYDATHDLGGGFSGKARAVQWWKQRNGTSDWILLAEERGLDPDLLRSRIPDNTSSKWVVQVSLKELGATFTNITLRPNVANIFLPPAVLLPTLVPLYGDNTTYPATAALQNDNWRTYIARERVAHAIFKQLLNPMIMFNCEVLGILGSGLGGTQYVSAYTRGDFVKVTSRRAGWGITAGDLGADNRPTLIVRSVSRVENPLNVRRPFYRLSLGSPQYDLTDPGRNHLTKLNEKTPVPQNLTIPIVDGLDFFFYDPTTNDGYYGDTVELRVTGLGKGGDATLPAMFFDAADRKLTLPAGAVPPGSPFTVQHRTITKSGKVKSEWSDPYSGVAPNSPAYDRNFGVSFPIGNGVDPIEVPADATLSQEIQIQESSALVDWEIVLNEAAALSIDVQWCSAEARRLTGAGAYASLVSTGAKPHTAIAIYSGKANHGTDLRSWHAHTGALKAGDWLRVVVTAATDVVATQGTLTLALKRLSAPGSNFIPPPGGWESV